MPLHRRVLVLTAYAILPLTAQLFGVQVDAAPRRPFPQHVRYAAGTIRPTSLNQTQQDADVRAFYDHWSQSYLVAAGSAGGHPLYRVTFGTGDPDRTVSEGQGYGMITVALMAGYDDQAQARFDGLWEFSRAHPSNVDSRLMGWQIPVVPSDNDSAFDGDADIAYALLLADAQWGSAGRIDYHAAALEVMSGILESTIGPQSHLPMLGDWVEANGSTYNQYTPRSSDFMPGHFRAYARASGNPVWLQVLGRSQEVVTSLQSGFSPTTGLLPDFIVPVSPSNHAPRPAPPNFLESTTDDDYSYNAGRDPWRLGTDVLLSGDAISRDQTQRISRWAETAAGGNAASINAGYKLDGTSLPGSDYFTTFFAAPLGVAAMTVPTQQEWLNKVYTAVRVTHEDYYEDSVTMLCLLVMTGNFWDPTVSTVVGSGPLALVAFSVLALMLLARVPSRPEAVGRPGMAAPTSNGKPESWSAQGLQVSGEQRERAASDANGTSRSPLKPNQEVKGESGPTAAKARWMTRSRDPQGSPASFFAEAGRCPPSTSVASDREQVPDRGACSV